jgi:hypothetical protein
MSDSRKKPGTAFWIVVVLITVFIAYPLSFGPACWACSRVPGAIVLWETADFFYAPILWAWWSDDPGTISSIIAWYANLESDGGLSVARMLDGSFCIINSGSR